MYHHPAYKLNIIRGGKPLCAAYLLLPVQTCSCPTLACSLWRGSLISQPPTGLNLWGTPWKPVRGRAKAREPGFTVLPQNATAPASKPSPHLSPLQLLQTASFSSVLRPGNNIILLISSVVYSTKDSTQFSSVQSLSRVRLFATP